VLFTHSGNTAGMTEQQASFQIYTLDTGSGTVRGRRFARWQVCGNRRSKGSVVPMGIEEVEEMQIWSFRDRKLVANKKLAQQTYAKTSDIPTDYDEGLSDTRLPVQSS